jgi:hypothetical protein
VSVTRAEAYPSHSRIASSQAHAAGVALIQVSWDASPDLEEFLRFVSTYAKRRFSGNLAERVALATNELLDNAVRYGSLAREFSYQLVADRGAISVYVHNTTVLTRIEMLSSHLKRLEGSAEQVYASELERSASGGGRRSMLGLARVRHEAEMKLELAIDGLDITMRAHCPR